MSAESTTPLASGLLVTGDLIFLSKITGTARALGFELATVSTPAAAIERLKSGGTRGVILDMALGTLQPESIRQIVAAAAPAKVIAFGSHVDVERLESARQAGCADVMPRSRFSATLPELLRELLA